MAELVVEKSSWNKYSLYLGLSIVPQSSVTENCISPYLPIFVFAIGLRSECYTSLFIEVV